MAARRCCVRGLVCQKLAVAALSSIVVVTAELLLPAAAVARNIVLSRLLSNVAKSWSQPEYTSSHRQRSSLTTNLLLHLRLTQSSDMGLQGIQPEGSLFAALHPSPRAMPLFKWSSSCFVPSFVRSLMAVLQTLSLTTCRLLSFFVNLFN